MNICRFAGFMECGIGIVLGAHANIQNNTRESILALCTLIVGAFLLSLDCAWEKK